MVRLVVLLALSGILSMAGCAPRPSNAPQTGLPPPLEEDAGPNPANVVSGVGMIVYLDFEGGFYGLVADDGARYDPLNLDETFKKDSLRVRFRAEKRTDVMTTRMWGRPVHILEMLPVTVEQND